MKTIIATILFLATTPLFSYGQLSASEVLKHSSKTLRIRKSMEYQADCKFKYLDSDDTFHFAGNVHLYKELTDTIFGGYIWYNISDSVFKFYDLNGIYEVNRKKDTVTRYNPHNGEYWAMTGNIRHRLVFDYFFEPEKLNKYATGKTKLSLLKDTIINKEVCYHLFLSFQDSDEFSESQAHLFIKKSDKTPILKISSIKFQGNYQYFEMFIRDYSYNTVNKSRFSINQLKPGSIIDSFKARKAAPPKPLEKGIKAPLISGKNYNNNLSKQTIDYNGKVTILDFWYMSCYPCIKAIPALEEIHKEYKDKGVQVIGINYHDNSDERIKKLPEFLEHNTIEYPIVFVDISTVKDYRVRAWPTFYIIDTDGTIAYSALGFGENTADEMKEALLMLLDN